jgi:plastocyanin
VRCAAALVFALAVALPGCGGSDSSSKAPGVQAADFRFAPATVRVHTGDAVEWRNSGRTDHTVKGPGFFSRDVPPGGRWKHRFATPGTFRYLCTLHPDAMKGTVVVTAP